MSKKQAMSRLPNKKGTRIEQEECWSIAELLCSGVWIVTVVYSIYNFHKDFKEKNTNFITADFI